MKLKKMITVCGCALVVVAAGAMAAATVLTSYNTVTDGAESQVEVAVDSYDKTIASKIDAFKKQIMVAAGNSNLHDAEKTMEDRKALLQATADITDFSDFSIAGTDGKTYSDTDLSAREYFKQAMAGTTYISSPLVRMTNNSIVVMAASKLTDGSGAIYGAIPYTTFSALIDGLKIGDTGYAFILDKDGVIIAHQNDDYVRNLMTFAQVSETETGYSSLASLSTKMIAGETGTTTLNVNGVDCYVGYNKIEGPEGWSFAVVVPRAELIGGFYATLVSALVVILACVVVGLLAGIFLAKALGDPIIKVTKRLTQLADGDLRTPSPKMHSSTAEFKQLYSSMDNTITSLKNYVGDIDSVIGGLASKNLKIAPSVEYKGDFSNIKNSLLVITDNLNEIFKTLSQVTGGITLGSGQIASGSQNLADSSIQQTQNIETLCGNIENISKQVENTVSITNKAADLVKEAVDGALSGNEKMKLMLNSMTEISESSDEIRKIIKTIEDIAFQTNILALNAAVEAARAGEAGKGFAVVADEVRTLASKSAEAASNTTSLIANSISAVEKGTSIADDTAASLSEIVTKVEQMNALMSEISSASEQQSAKLNEVSEGIERITAATQNTSATSEECAAASREFEGEAVTLQNIVKEFDIRN